MQTANRPTSISTMVLDLTNKLICIGKKGNYLTPLAGGVTLNYLSRRLLFQSRGYVCGVFVPFVVIFAGCSVKKGRLETENRDVLWLSSDPDQTVTSPSTQGMLRDKMFCCYCSMATLQTKIHVYSHYILYLLIYLVFIITRSSVVLK